MHINRYICKICAILATKNKQMAQNPNVAHCAVLPGIGGSLVIDLRGLLLNVQKER